MNNFAKMCRKLKQRKTNRKVQNIENDNENDKKSVNNAKNYNTKNNRDSSSSNDNCVAIISYESKDKIAPIDVYLYTTLLLDSGLSVNSHKRRQNYQEAKWVTEKRQIFESFSTSKGFWNINSNNRNQQLKCQKFTLRDFRKRCTTIDWMRFVWKFGDLHKTTASHKKSSKPYQQTKPHKTNN